MFNFCSLYSGSSGNSLFVESENTKLLVDAGVSSKKIEEALANLEIDPTSIDGILITHEHSDHVQGLGTFAKKFNLPVFVNEKTLDAMPKQKEKISENVELVIKNTICLATETRQKETEKLSKQVELMIIIGGKNSSNTKKLYEIAKQNCHNSISVENGKEAEETLKNMDLSTIEKVGIMAGASTPKESIDEVIKVWHLFK